MEVFAILYRSDRENQTPLQIAKSSIGKPQEPSEEAPFVKPDYAAVVKMLKQAGAK